MILTLVSESTVEPVSVNELKTYLKMDSTDSTSEDGLMGSFITVARKQAENITKRALTVQSRILTLNHFPNLRDPIELPRAPLSTASSDITITYVKNTVTGATTTIDSTSITVDHYSEPGRVYPSYYNLWPLNTGYQYNSVQVAYISGYSTLTTPVPEPVISWIKMRAADLYENRQAITSDIMKRIPREFANGMLDEYVIMAYGENKD